MDINDLYSSPKEQTDTEDTIRTVDSAETADIADKFLEKLQPTSNLDARRRVEEYREQRELEQLMGDDWDYFEDVG